MRRTWWMRGGAWALALVVVAQPSAQSQPPAPVRASRVVAPDGIGVVVQEWGNPAGPDILFIHGYSQSHLAWTKQVTGDLARRFRMVTYDLRGHGQSDKPEDPRFYQDARRWADEVQAVIDATRLRRPVLVAWSYAGRIATDYLTAHGDGRIAGVNYVAATTSNERNAAAPAGPALAAMASDDPATSIAATREFLRLSFSRVLPADEFETMLAFTMMTPARVRAGLRGRPTDYAATLSQIRVPVLVTHGEEDKVVLPAVGRYTAATVPGARTSFYAGVGHAPFWEDAARFNRELGAFVAAAAESPAGSRSEPALRR